MSDPRFKWNGAVFVAAFLAATVAALTTGAWLTVAGGFSLGSAGATLLIAMFALPPFLVVFAALGLLYASIERENPLPLFRLAYFSLLGAAAGAAIPFVMGAIAGSPQMAAAGGFVGGVLYSYLWAKKSSLVSKTEEDQAVQ